MIMGMSVRSERGKEGFTLIEVIVVLVIIAILAAFTIPTFIGFIDKAHESECLARTEMLTRDCQEEQKKLTDSPTRIVKIDRANAVDVDLMNKIFFQAVEDEYGVDVTNPTSKVKVIEKDGRKMIAGLCKDGGNYYVQLDNYKMNIYCDEHDGIIPDVAP